MKILVTGSRGFLGRHLVVNLRDYDCEVVEFDIKAHDWMDITDFDACEKIIKEQTPNVVFHLAANPSPAKSMEDPVFDLTINAIGTLNILRAVIKFGVDIHLIFASTAYVYGEPQYVPIDEKHELNPSSPYGISKLTAENYVRFFHKRYGLNYTICRFFNIYGPGQRAGFVVPDFIYRAKELDPNEPFMVYGTANDSRDFIYVEDVVEALLSILKTGPLNREINIGSGKETKIVDLARIVLGYFGKNPWIHCTKKEGKVTRLLSDISVAKKELQWNPIFDLHEGIEKTIRSCLES